MGNNAANIVEIAEVEAIAADARLDLAGVNALLADIVKNVERLAQNAEEIALDQALVRAEPDAVVRHCGAVQTVYAVTDPVAVQQGKDLWDVPVVIARAVLSCTARISVPVLEMTFAEASAPGSLRSKAPKRLLDRGGLLYACGLLGGVEPQAAFELVGASLDVMDREPFVERTLTA